MLQNKVKAMPIKFGNNNEAGETTGWQTSDTDCDREKQWEDTNKKQIKKEKCNFLTLSLHTDTE